MKLIAGLGNPGLRYRNTRHNIGFVIVDKLAKKYRLRIKKRLYKALIATGKIIGQDATLVLPQTYMNLSGEAVASARGEVDSLKDMLIVFDDIDLPLGSIRFRSGGSSAGHRGLESIIGKLKTDGFPRLRIGIRPEIKPVDISGFVLRPFSKDERVVLKETVERAVEGIETWVSHGIEECMRLYNHS